MFVLGASIAGLTTWRLNEALRAHVEKLNAELEQRVVERTAQLEAVNAELDAANQELEAFSYSVSHDLRAPLRTIDGFSQALMEDFGSELEGEGQDSLQRIRAATGRMNRLIEDLLEFSRLGRHDMRRQSVDLTELAHTVALGLRNTQPDRDVTFDIVNGLVANGDQRLLRVVLENLMGNAWKFTGKHSCARIEFGVADSEGRPTFFVRDDGAGFDATYADRLFRPFQRLHGTAEFDGTGIGLATVQRILTRHGGRIWAESAPEQGATFFFSLS